MSDPTPAHPEAAPTIWRCLVGAAIAGGLAAALYSLTLGIAQTFAQHPLQTSNSLAMRISVAVRTLVVGVSALGTGVFALTMIGLVALAIQLGIQRWQQRSEP